MEAVTFLIKNCYYTIGNMVFKQDIRIPMGINPILVLSNLLLYFFQSKHAQNIISKKLARA